MRKATWDEIDLDGATWMVPAERMKANREHRVPLSKRALEMLAAAADVSDGSGLPFLGRPLNENTHAKLLMKLRFDVVTHGFRSSFRNYTAERTHTSHAVMEATRTGGVLVGLPRRLIAQPSVGSGAGAEPTPPSGAAASNQPITIAHSGLTLLTMTDIVLGNGPR